MQVDEKCTMKSHSALPWQPRNYSKLSISRSKNATCPFRIRVRASFNLNQSARSISGNSTSCPDFGGHLIENVLLPTSVGEQSPSNAQAEITFPPDCFVWSSAMNFPSALIPVSSSNSRFAASSGSSPSSYSPLGIDHAPASFFFQNGPPGCTRNTCKFNSRRLYINSPALLFGISIRGVRM